MIRVTARWWFVLLALVWTTGIAFGQESTPAFGAITTLEAGDFRALAVTQAGDRLLVADGENQQVRVYDFTDPSQPELLTSLDVSGTPVLLAGCKNYGIVAETTDGDTDTVEVIAPALPYPNVPYMAGHLYIDIPKSPLTLALSPDNKWAILVGANDYTLMSINGADDMTALPVNETFTDAALSETTAYWLRDQNLASAPLDQLEAMQASLTLPLDGTPSLVTLAPNKGVVVVDDTRLIFFDLSTLEVMGEFTVTGKPITSVHFLTKADGTEYLLVTQQDSNRIQILDTRDLAKVAALPDSPTMDSPIRALTVYDQYMIATDGVSISIFAA